MYPKNILCIFYFSYGEYADAELCIGVKRHDIFGILEYSFRAPFDLGGDRDRHSPGIFPPEDPGEEA